MDSHSPSKTSPQANGAGSKPVPKQPSPKKSPLKASSKLALMKKRADDAAKKSKLVISPKKEPITQAPSESAAAPKTSVPAGSAKHVSSPKSGGGSNKTSPTKPEVEKIITASSTRIILFSNSIQNQTAELLRLNERKHAFEIHLL